MEEGEECLWFRVICGLQHRVAHPPTHRFQMFTPEGLRSRAWQGGRFAKHFLQVSEQVLTKVGDSVATTRSDPPESYLVN